MSGPRATGCRQSGTLLWRKTGPVSERDTVFTRMLEEALAAPAPVAAAVY